jgi:hypothetical protein
VVWSAIFFPTQTIAVLAQLNIDQSEHKEFQATHDPQRNAQGQALIRNDKHYTLREALGTGAFWILAYGFLQPAVVNSAIIFHAGSIASSHGMLSSNVLGLHFVEIVFRLFHFFFESFLLRYIDETLQRLRSCTVRPC